MTILPIVIENGVQYNNIFSPTPDAFRKLLKQLKERFSNINLRALSSKPIDSLQELLTDK